jgi:hypothetical protein
MLSDTLVTNEVKDAAGVEIEFERISSSARSTEFAKKGELPGLPHRLTVSHQETSSGADKRRRSVVRFDVTSMGADTVTPVKTSAYAVLDIPVGNIGTYDDAKKATANLMSLLASLGASTTILYDCTGNGAKALVEGTL